MSQGYKRINENDIHALVSTRTLKISNKKKYNIFDNVVLHRNSRSWTYIYTYVADKMDTDIKYIYIVVK
jgi:hypothetical protein